MGALVAVESSKPKGPNLVEMTPEQAARTLDSW